MTTELGLPEPAAVEAVLCDADGNLFDSEAPAFAASAGVTNRFLESRGISSRFTDKALRRATTGKNFRTTAQELLVALGKEQPDPQELERWVEEEKRVVTAHLQTVLVP